MNKRITVFTPTYNRAHTLERCYKSLCSQTNKDFIWLIIDDGSTDNTKEAVEKWVEENKIEIRYAYKENGGLHTGYNKAYELCDTELLVCLDSDDDFEIEAIDIILKACQGEEFERCLGLVTNQHYRESGKIIGNDFPKQLEKISYYDFYYRYNLMGDKVFVIKTKYIKNFRFPVFDNEKLYPTGDVYLNVKGEYKIIRNKIMNKEYLEDGYTKSSLKKYILNPKGFAASHRYKMTILKGTKRIIKSTIQYIGNAKLARNNNIINNSPKKLVTIVLYPLGIVWYCILSREKKKMVD